MLEHYLTPYTANKRIVAQQGVLVLAPHPDDEIFGCGGALAQHVADQTPLQVVILSDGQAQGMADMRRAESCAAAQVIGYGTPVFWGLSDRQIHYSEALVNKVIDVLWENHLDLVYCPSPMELHPDHRQTALIAIEAIKRLGGNYRVAFYEISAPLHPNVLLDISAQAAIKTADDVVMTVGKVANTGKAAIEKGTEIVGKVSEVVDKVSQASQILPGASMYASITPDTLQKEIAKEPGMAGGALLAATAAMDLKPVHYLLLVTVVTIILGGVIVTYHRSKNVTDERNDSPLVPEVFREPDQTGSR